MNVLDHEPHRWYLLQDEGTLLLDVHCSHGPVDYCWTMALSQDETSGYLENGREFLNRLADQVQNSAPGVLGSHSPFKGRNLHPGCGDRVLAATRRWHDAARNAAANV
ncbi:hypothetical protein [Xanthomonas maliensis]|uniref:hypothetical protein n=1 Tax=Xanthomonas maliensis TaxID=1321368 RepID=UPI0003A26C1E|nr:hypothetical protein [Xanthomonas maliensis]KAB7769693.1 hypothetical protein CKY51_06010 [Xanthomonas maliensis]